MKFQVSAIALGCIALLSGCGGGGSSSDSTSGGMQQSISFPFPGGGSALIGIPPQTATVKLMATASSGGAVTYTSNTTDICTVNGDTLSLIKAGECSVTANQAGGSGYAPASQKQLFVIPKNPQKVVKFQNPGWQPVGGTPVQLSASFDSGLSATFTSKTPTVCSVSGNKMTPLDNGICIVTASQLGNDIYAEVSADKNIPIGTEKPAKLNFLTGYKDGSTTNEGVIGHPGNFWWCMQCTSTASADNQTLTFTATWDTPPQPGDWNYNAGRFSLFGPNLTDADLWADDTNGWYRGGVSAFNLPTAKPEGVQIEIEGALHFNLAQNPEWFGTSNNKFNVELFLGHFNTNKLDAKGNACAVTLKATVQPTAAAATDYSVNLQSQFAISETCDLSGLDLWNELQSYPVVQINFSAAKMNSEVANGAGKYVNQFMLTGPIYFQ
jgi:hypothetical protein